MFNNSYINLPETFYQRIDPTLVANPKLLKYNTALAQELGLELEQDKLADYFSGNEIIPGSEPLAQAYSGHQFGHFNPSLGDGRACLLAEKIDTNSKRRDIQLKGSGPTAYSRRGDGRAALGPVLREYVVSEAMYALGVPTTRSLAAVSTGESIYREEKLPGAILTRVASSHIRVGTFEYFASRQDYEALKILADYSIDRHYPELSLVENKYEKFLEAVGERQATLVSHWMGLGFIHGVMNTDNFSISGETIDYGPCAFMDYFNSFQVFSSIDRDGRYAYSNQPNIVLWNMTCLANTLIPLVDKDPKQAAAKLNPILEEIKLSIEDKVSTKLISKMGLERDEVSLSLLQNFMTLMHKYRADFTLSFRYLAKVLAGKSQDFVDLFDKSAESLIEIQDWIKDWETEALQKTTKEELIAKLNSLNPAYIPRNHIIEDIIYSASSKDDLSLMEDALECFSNPYEEQEKFSAWLKPPADKDQEYVTFCGT